MCVLSDWMLSSCAVLDSDFQVREKQILTDEGEEEAAQVEHCLLSLSIPFRVNCSPSCDPYFHCTSVRSYSHLFSTL